MGARATPIGDVPESRSSDVKTKDVSSEEKEAKAASQTEQAKVEDEVDESDLKEIEEGQKIPYSRFKEKNDEAKRLRAEIESSSRIHQEEMQRLIQEREALRAMSQRAQTEEPIFNLDDNTGKEVKELRQFVTTLKGEIDELKGQGVNYRLKELKAKYPDANELAALGIKKHNPKLDLEDIMETLHNEIAEKTNARLRSIIDQKKAKAKSAAPVMETGFKIKETERPKTLKEAHALLKRFQT